MKKDEWIASRMDVLKSHGECVIPESTLAWIADMFDIAWQHGNIEGSKEAYDNVNKWRNETK